MILLHGHLAKCLVPTTWMVILFLKAAKQLEDRNCLFFVPNSLNYQRNNEVQRAVSQKSEIFYISIIDAGEKRSHWKVPIKKVLSKH